MEQVKVMEMPVQIGDTYKVLDTFENAILMSNDKEIRLVETLRFTRGDTENIENMEFIYDKINQEMLLKDDGDILYQDYVGDREEMFLFLLNCMEYSGWDGFNKPYIYFLSSVNYYLEELEHELD